MTGNFPEIRPDGDTLALVSLLSGLLKGVSEPSWATLAEASGAFRLVSRLDWPSDEFGEVSELLCGFAFVSWRHARALGDARLAQEWIERFDQRFPRDSIDRQCVDYFVRTSASDRSVDLNDTFLLNPETLFSICAFLRDERNAHPVMLAKRIPVLLQEVEARFWPTTFRDERAYFLGQLEISAGVCARWTGHRGIALEWFHRAGERYAGTSEAETGDAELQLMRLTVSHDEGNYAGALSALPELQRRLSSLSMSTALVTSQLLQSAALKNTGRVTESMIPLENALKSPILEGKLSLRAFVLAFLADSCVLLGRFTDAAEFSTAAYEILKQTKEANTLAFLMLIRGESFRVQGQMADALVAYCDARRAYETIGLESWAAYARLLTGEVLLFLGREQEAEVEILAALPAIENHRLVREGLSAIALLRESIRRRKTDRNALRELRERLQGKR